MFQLSPWNIAHEIRKKKLVKGSERIAGLMEAISA
jgi:hypothetical protein